MRALRTVPVDRDALQAELPCFLVSRHDVIHGRLIGHIDCIVINDRVPKEGVCRWDMEIEHVCLPMLDLFNL